MQIDGKTVGGDRCYVIAECGHNHGGNLAVAKRMIRRAAESGADAVKFQIRDNKNLYTSTLYNSAYNSENAYGPTYGAHREALELEPTQLVSLQTYAAQQGITMFATAFDTYAVDLCAELGFPAIKIASGDLTNTPLIHYAAQVGVPLIMSTGGGTDEDVSRALDTVYDVQGEQMDVALLQCTASYPAPYSELDLGVIATWRQLLRHAVVVGASLHDNGIAMAVAAYCMGARVIEKHVTLDRTMKGTDHAFSLEPQGLAKMVRDLRRVETALGPTKRVYPDELAPITKMSKSVYASRSIASGTPLTAEDLCFKSPGGGLPPYMAVDLVGKVCPVDLSPDDPIPVEVTHGTPANAAARALLGESAH